ncbi:SEC-C metal-binding domain-containing protein [Aeromonas dhakensis]|uniref:SEC-C metal-binding domain-containing protein n=1 Tax=Aeromonas dhakensis TaxID=196024 RepID=UPI001A8C9D15|nr:SEC-C metal-binding domain-containing protein [Aeromonas dhakensis]
MATLKRNDTCYCGSGKKYKVCHMISDSKPPKNRLTAQQSAYLNNWSKNSYSLEEQGCYEWMASIAIKNTPEKILDIGCGNGSGIIALLRCSKNIKKIIALDENLACLKATKQRLEDEGYSVELIERVEVKDCNKSEHEFLYSPINEKSDSLITLIHSDILSDPFVSDYLDSQGGFDLVTIWLIGTHTERRNCNNISELKISNNGEYRLRVQNKIYELADTILTPGGVLHVTDRGEIPSSVHLQNDFIDAHKDQASVTSLVVKELEYKEYSETEAAGAIQLTKTLGKSGRDVDFSSKAILSVRSQK